MTDDEILMFLAYSFGVSDKEQNTKTYPSEEKNVSVEIYLIPNISIQQSSKIFSKAKFSAIML